MARTKPVVSPEYHTRSEVSLVADIMRTWDTEKGSKDIKLTLSLSRSIHRREYKNISECTHFILGLVNIKGLDKVAAGMTEDWVNVS